MSNNTSFGDIRDQDSRSMLPMALSLLLNMRKTKFVMTGEMLLNLSGAFQN